MRWGEGGESSYWVQGSPEAPVQTPPPSGRGQRGGRNWQMGGKRVLKDCSPIHCLPTSVLALCVGGQASGDSGEEGGLAVSWGSEVPEAHI